MNIDWQIVQAFTLITGIFFALGAPLKWKIPQIPFLCLPSAGMVFFGGLIVPVLYFTGGWHPIILYTTVAILLGLGLVSLFLIIKTARPAKPTLFSAVILFLFILIVAGFIVQSSKYAVPGGIDSAIHAAYISNIVQFNNFSTSYPLGVHIFILFIENILSYSAPTIMLALQIFFIVNIFIIAYYIIKTISNNKVAGMIGILAIIFDASIYNNYLNGSITHLLAILLILIGIALTLMLLSNNKRQYFLIITVFYASVFYFHFITLFIVIPVLWFLRIYHMNRQHWLSAIAFPLSLLAAAPLLVNFLSIPGFKIQFIAGCLIVLLVEAIILFYSGYIKKILFNKWTQLLFAIMGLFAFKSALKAFDVIPEWYELFILSLAPVGIILIIFKKLRDWYPIVIYFSFFSIFYYIFDFASAHIDSPIFKELLFYYGFTVPLVLLSAVGLFYGLRLMSGRKAKMSILAVLFIIAILISSSRFFDKIFLSNAQAISRYGRNDGFGMFYNEDDVKVALWAKKHLSKDASIINPGGLYNTWANLTERRIMYVRGEINSPESEKTHKAVVDLLNNQSIGCPQQLLKQKFQYLLLPSQYQAHFQNDCVNLIYQSGSARLFKINDFPKKSIKTQAMNLSDLTQNKEIFISGNFKQICVYCGNRLYYQFESVGRLLRVPTRGIFYINIAGTDYDRSINLLIDGQNSSFYANIVGRDDKELQFSKKYILENYPQQKGEDIRLQLKNTGDHSADIYSIDLEVL